MGLTNLYHSIFHFTVSARCVEYYSFVRQYFYSHYSSQYLFKFKMAKRKRVFTRNLAKSKREKAARRRETEEKRMKRLALERKSLQHIIESQNETQREQFRAKARDRMRSNRNRETEEQRRIRNDQSKEKMLTLRRNRRIQAQEQNTSSANVLHKSRHENLNLDNEAFHYDRTKEYNKHPYVNIGKMDEICKFCHAKKFKHETPSLCCKSGKVKLPSLQKPPRELFTYMIGETLQSKHFLQNIRRYNACFQMTSFGATFIPESDGFHSVFKIQGQIYHTMGSLLPLPNETPKFLQVYFMGDDELEVDQRCANIAGLRREIVCELQHLLHKHNQLINVFKTARERMISDRYKVVIKADKKPIGEHERRYNAPQVNEVAVVIVDNECTKRDIIIQRRGCALQRIAETHRSYDALQYPLIFWQGEDGYHLNIQQINPKTGALTNKKVTSKEFYAYRIMIRKDEYNHILNCRQLFQQFVVDMYAKIEAERLMFIRYNQKKLRTDEYIHLRDAMKNDGNIDDMGKLVILPSTFTGSPRHMFEYAQDAMTYVRKHGRPDLFITFTCNSSWSEIKENLSYGQSANDRHDLIARIFRQKQFKFIEIIVKKQIFGFAVCWIYSIEWQKRGLPHSHNLIWLKEKIRSNQIDDVIRAEFPNPQEDPDLYDVIVKNMIHGPCGLLNKDSPCMRDNKCTKRYPRSFSNETQTGEDGYPKYRRRSPENGGFTAKIKMKNNAEIEVDNQWVVPYSPLLSKMFQAHINVEYCNSVKAIKYILTYIHKGSDMAVIGLTKENEHDEIVQYQMGRYINSNEAIWRVLGFPIHDRDPPVVHLSVHLENGQRVYFTRETAQKVASEPVNTTLTAFFKLCQNDPFAKKLLYPEVSNYYTWDMSEKKFNRRKRGMPVQGHDDVFKDNTIGRVYTVHPKNAECFFLRLLLHKIRGPTSFSDLKTVDGYTCETYREACQRLGLLENDKHWEYALSEAAQTATAHQIRELFAIILTSCNPSNPNELWMKFRESMSDDILAEMQRIHPFLKISFNDDIFNKALILLENKCIEIGNQTLIQLGIQPPQRNEFDALNTELLNEKSYNVEELGKYIEQNKPLLIESQKHAYDIIINHIEKQQGGIIFLDAPGGTGKTFLINLILAEIRIKGGIALALASSGIAATMMDGGKTAHSGLKLPLNVAELEFPVCDITRTSPSGQVLRLCQAIFWDECTMAHKKSFEALNKTLQDLRNNTKLMGGVLLILSGDFRQTLPVIPKGTPADEINACLKNSFIWQHIKKVSLTTNMRAQISGNKKAQLFAEKLLQIGEGTFPVDEHSGEITLTNELCNIVETPEQLINKIYPNISQNYVNSEWLYERSILATKNEIVNNINETIQDMIPGTLKIYNSIDTMVDENDSVNFPTEFLNSLNVPGMPLHSLKLKIGSPIILLRNLNSPKLCNGTRLCVKQLLNNVIEAKILTGKDKGNTVFIPRIPLISNEQSINFKRLQFPVKLAYSITINKAQGQTFKWCGINLKEPCFSHGQLYVACSRVGAPENLFIYSPNNKTSNIVYKQVL